MNSNYAEQKQIVLKFIPAGELSSIEKINFLSELIVVQKLNDFEFFAILTELRFLSATLEKTNLNEIMQKTHLLAAVEKSL